MKHKGIFIPLIIVGGVVALAVTVIGGLNIAKFFIYSDYYKIETPITDCPGLKDDFIPQGMSVVPSTGKYIISGYMKDGSASRIYVTDTTKATHMMTLTLDGEDFKGHCGGVANDGTSLYISDTNGDDSGVYLVSLETVLNTETSVINLESSKFYKVDGRASFVFADNSGKSSYIYVGEFHRESNYVCNHPIETETEGTHYAVVGKYRLPSTPTPSDDAQSETQSLIPEYFYSIRNLVQGFALSKDGDIALSTSYGLSSSHFYVYDYKNIKDSGKTIQDKPVYILENETKVIKAPAMSEDLDYNINDNKIYFTTESASDKYIFGKLFNAYQINALDIFAD